MRDLPYVARHLRGQFRKNTGMALFVLVLMILNVVLGLALVVAMSMRGQDAVLLRLQGRNKLSRGDQDAARRERLEAEQNAWRFDD